MAILGAWPYQAQQGASTSVPPPTCSGSLQGIPQASQLQQSGQQESLCSEMARELCRAIRCHASSRRRKACEKCSTHVVGYHIDNSTPTPINGRNSLGLEMSPHIHMHHHSPPQDYDGN